MLVKCEHLNGAAKEAIMKRNEGNLDRIVRVGGGAALVAWAALGGPVWAWIGLMPIATGLIGFCPAYTLIGINTCPMKKD